MLEVFVAVVKGKVADNTCSSGSESFMIFNSDAVEKLW